MALKKYILVFVLLNCCWLSSTAHPLISNRADTLTKVYNKAIYAAEFADAQTIIYQYLSRTDLSVTERFYGEYLQACIYRSAGSPKLATERLLKLQTRILELPAHHHPAFEALILGKLAECYFDQQSYDTAYHYAKHSVNIKPYQSPNHLHDQHVDSMQMKLPINGNPLRSNGHAINYLILGAYENRQNNYSAAETYYNKAAQIYKQQGDLCEMPLVYIKIARLKLRKGDPDACLVDLQTALALSDSCNIKQYRFLSRASLVHYYKKTGQFEKAAEESEALNQVSMQIYQEEQRIHINELQIKYQTELAKSENKRLREITKLQEQQTGNKVIVLLSIVGILFLILVFTTLILRLRQAQNQKLEDQVQQIQHQKQERDALLKEVHHRVKNNLQVITSLLHLESTKQQPILASHTENSLFQSSQDRINALALVHELLYQSETLATIPLKEYVRNLLDSLIQSYDTTYKNIQFQLDLAPIELDLDTATPLGLLFNEILTNSLTHGFQDTNQGKLYIRGQQINPNQHVFYIGDNGVGYNAGVDFNTQETLGFNLMRRLARQLNGKIKQINHTEKGCHYKLTIQWNSTTQKAT